MHDLLAGPVHTACWPGPCRCRGRGCPRGLPRPRGRVILPASLSLCRAGRLSDCTASGVSLAGPALANGCSCLLTQLPDRWDKCIASGSARPPAAVRGPSRPCVHQIVYRFVDALALVVIELVGRRREGAVQEPLAHCEVQDAATFARSEFLARPEF